MAVAVVLLQVPNELLHVVHVVVEVKVAFFHWHQAGVFPIGDVHLVVFQQRAHGVAQQRGVVARQRCHQKHHRLHFELGQGGGVIRKALEAAQLAKRLVDLYAFVDGYGHAIHAHGRNTEGGLLVVLAQAVQQIVAGGNALRKRGLAQRRQRCAVELGGGLRKIGKRLHQGTLGFVDVVQHGGADKKCCTAQNITAQGRLCIAQAALCAWHGGATLGGNTPSRSPN